VIKAYVKGKGAIKNFKIKGQTPLSIIYNTLFTLIKMSMCVYIYINLNLYFRVTLLEFSIYGRTPHKYMVDFYQGVCVSQ